MSDVRPTNQCPYLSYEEAAFREGVSVRTVRRWVAEREVSTIGRGPGRRIVASSLAERGLREMQSAECRVQNGGLPSQGFATGLVEERRHKAWMEFLRPLVKQVMAEEGAGESSKLNVQSSKPEGESTKEAA